MNHLVNCGEPLSEPFRDYYFKKVSRIVASVSQTFLCNIPYVHVYIQNVRKLRMVFGMWIVYQAILQRGTPLLGNKQLPVMNVYQKAPLVLLWNVIVFAFTCTNVTTNATFLITGTYANTFIVFIPSHK